jgi:hypothetical protein
MWKKKNTELYFYGYLTPQASLLLYPYGRPPPPLAPFELVATQISGKGDGPI